MVCVYLHMGMSEQGSEFIYIWRWFSVMVEVLPYLHEGERGCKVHVHGKGRGGEGICGEGRVCREV